MKYKDHKGWRKRLSESMKASWKKRKNTQAVSPMSNLGTRLPFNSPCINSACPTRYHQMTLLEFSKLSNAEIGMVLDAGRPGQQLIFTEVIQK